MIRSLQCKVTEPSVQTLNATANSGKKNKQAMIDSGDVLPMVDEDADEMQMEKDDDGILGDDDKKKSLKEKYRQKRAKKHIDKGREILFNDFPSEIPFHGNTKGVALKLKRKWVKEKFWPYYAKYLEDEYGYKVNSYEEFLVLDNKTSTEYFNVPGYSGGTGTDDAGKIPQDKKVEEPQKDVEKEGQKKQIEDATTDVNPDGTQKVEKKTEILPAPGKTILKVVEQDEKKILITHYESVKVFSNGDHIGQNVDGSVTLDPAKTYVAVVRGILIKDKVVIYAGGTKTGDTDFRGGKRFFKIPKGADNVTVHGETGDKKKSYLEIEINYDMQKQETRHRTKQIIYYTDNSQETRIVNQSTVTEDVPFTFIDILDRAWLPDGVERVVIGK